MKSKIEIFFDTVLENIEAYDINTNIISDFISYGLTNNFISWDWGKLLDKFRDFEQDSNWKKVLSSGSDMEIIKLWLMCEPPKNLSADDLAILDLAIRRYGAVIQIRWARSKDRLENKEVERLLAPLLEGSDLVFME